MSDLLRTKKDVWCYLWDLQNSVAHKAQEAKDLHNEEGGEILMKIATNIENIRRVEIPHEQNKITYKDLWLKLFAENDVALACAIHFCSRFVQGEELSAAEKEFIVQKKEEICNAVTDEQMLKTFPNWSGRIHLP